MEKLNVNRNKFCSPSEHEVCSIGTGYVANFLSVGETNKAGASLTNKRIYFSGSVLVKNNAGRFVSYKQEKIINTRDVTGTGYDFYSPVYFLWFGISTFVASLLVANATDGLSLYLGSILLIGNLIAYFIKRKTLLTIEFAGGNIAFDVRWIQKHEQEDFLRNIHLAKDMLYSASAVSQGFIKEDNDEIPEL